MKKLYKKGKVHPTPPTVSDHLAFLPATILALTAALSPEDREVLAYLISCSPGGHFSGGRKSSSNGTTSTDHQAMFQCNCFRCYMSYWVRWDASPNRKLIHDVIDAFEEEEELTKVMMKCSKKGKKEKKMMMMMKMNGRDLKRNNSNDQETITTAAAAAAATSGAIVNHIDDHDHDQVEINGGDVLSVEVEANHDDDDGVEEKGSAMRRFVSFIGEKIWGVWG
ncbi:hypothetical protein Scep_028862 [Stephania cephalantha]|uniref:Uncharacterized protein n=1 Tax=Stephania cephalantha TaxID=152367 RepID=A0AAP0ECT7_9MAGN